MEIRHNEDLVDNDNNVNIYDQVFNEIEENNTSPDNDIITTNVERMSNVNDDPEGNTENNNQVDIMESEVEHISDGVVRFNVNNDIQTNTQTIIIDLLSSTDDSTENNSNSNQPSESNSNMTSSDPSWIPSQDELSISNDNSNSDLEDNSSRNEMDVDNTDFLPEFNFRYIEGQQSNITQNGNLWFKNENYFFIFGFNYKSKFDLFRYNIFNQRSIPITTRQDEHNFVTKYSWPKKQYRMRFQDYENHDFIHTFFMKILKDNNTDIITIIHDKEFIMAGHPVIDSGGVSQEAINIFSNNFMRKLHQSYPNFFTHHNDMFYTFINTTSNDMRDEAIESFLLGSIFILMFTGRCSSLADPTLCASIFNYSEIIPLDFYDKYPNLYSFLDNARFTTYIGSLENDTNFNVMDFSNDEDHTWSKILYNFCEQCEINFSSATFHLKKGSFYAICKEKYCSDSVNIGSYIVDNYLENVLDNLSIKAHEFCQMVNYDTDVKDFYWEHYVKVKTLDQFMNCLTTLSKGRFDRHVRKLENSFGNINEIQDFSIVRDRVMNNSELEESKKVKLLVKLFFTIYLLKANDEEIFLLYKHITGEDYDLGYKGISISYVYYPIIIPDTFMKAHTCFKSLDLLIHVNQLDVILITFENFRAAVNSQLRGVAYNVT